MFNNYTLVVPSSHTYFLFLFVSYHYQPSFAISMMKKTVVRNIIPALTTLKKGTSSSNLFRYKNYDNWVEHNNVKLKFICRPYSGDINSYPENITADYNYVQKAIKNNKVLIIDVREPDEVKEHGAIPNSVNIPLGTITDVFSKMTDKDFENAFKKQKPKEDTEVICYCMIGKRSGMAQKNLINLGYKNVKNYLGSWTDWAKNKS